MDSSIVQAAKKFATEKLSLELPAYAKYHDLAHTQTVVSEVRDLAAKEGLDENTIRCLVVAAWFHDLGYLQKVQGHEAVSAEMVDDFLSNVDATDEERKLVQRLILVTEMKSQPKDKPEMLMRDADLAHLGLDIAAERSELLRQEKEILLGHPIKKRDWDKMNIDFFESHGYFTDAAKEKYGPAKEAYLKSFKAQVEKKSKKKPKKEKSEKAKSKKQGQGSGNHVSGYPEKSHGTEPNSRQ